MKIRDFNPVTFPPNVSNLELHHIGITLRVEKKSPRCIPFEVQKGSIHTAEPMPCLGARLGWVAKTTF